MGDETGGSGWEVELPDGTRAKYYDKLPPGIDVETWFGLPGMPGSSVAPFSDVPAHIAVRSYLDRMGQLVREAEAALARDG
jgi:hypothetical protein